MAELQRVDAAEIERRLAGLPADVLGAAPNVDATRWRWREATALVGCFSSGDLEDPAAVSSDALRRFILDDAEPVTTPTGQSWRLRASVREATIRRLVDTGGLEPARSNRLAPAPTDVGGAMAEAYVARSAPPLDRQTLAQLHGTLEAIEWLAPSAVPLPDPADVRGRLAIAKLLQPLRDLVGDDFVGRARELARLHAYVEPSAARRPRRRKAGRRPLRPLMIHGPGGLGKSTLIAKFMLDYTTPDADRHIPFAYLSFDRPDLRADAPLTLLAEAARQIGAQYPSLARKAVSIADSALGVHRAYVATRLERAPAAKSAAARRQQTGGDQRDILQRFAGLVSATGASDHPTVWVLDTFEVAQRSGPEAVDRTWRMLGELAAAVPGVRVIVAGRALVEGHDIDHLALGPLTSAEAIALLRARLGDMEVSDSFLRAAARRVGGNPLSLRLIAEVIRREGETALRKTSSRRRILFRIGAEELQGVLYRRILDHLPDEDLQRIANPGLVVRRITPDVIQHVLAKPCGLGDIDAGRARDLFERLTREASLVQQIRPDTVVHRADVRRVMLPLLVRGDAATVDQIHRRAVAWFKDQPGLEAKTEELYHRLALAQSASTLKATWDDDAAVALEDVLDELPPVSQAFLADRLGWTVDPAVLAVAEDETWARQTARVARNLLDESRPGEALALLRERSNPTVRPLTTPLIVEALAAMRDTGAAVALVMSSLRWATDEGRWTTYLDVELLGARVAEDAGDYDRALRWLRDARAVAGDVNDDALHLAAGVAMVRIHRRTGTEAAAAELRREVLTQATSLSPRELDRNPTLVRDLAAEFGSEHPEFVRRATKVAGLDTESPAGKVLADALSLGQQHDLASFVRNQIADGAELGSSDAAPPEEPEDLSWMATQTVVEQGRTVGDYLESAAGDASWNDAVVESYQAESDASAF
jgi:hypothetical protein